MSDPKTYTGGCHCGKVRYEVSTDLAQVVQCNCSICSKRGWMLTFVPESQFKLLSGEDALTDYQFNKKHIHHTFCATCGTAPFGSGAAPDGGKMFSINVRCLDDVDLSSLSPISFDGKAL